MRDPRTCRHMWEPDRSNEDETVYRCYWCGITRKREPRDIYED